MGQLPKTVVKTFKNRYYGDKEMEVELFTWEKLDCVDKIKKAFFL
jgi:S-adenosylmethionine synthetase